MTAIRTYLPRLLDGLWFHQLPEALREALLDAAVLRRLESGQRLFSRGDKPCGLYAVLEGAIRIGAVGSSGKEALLTLIEPPSWFGEIALFDGQPRTHDAYAEGATLLLNVPQPALLALLEREPRYWRDLALLMSQKLRLAFVESLGRQIDLLRRSRCDGNWHIAALRLKGLAASVKAEPLVLLAEEAIVAAPGDPSVVRRLQAFLDEFAGH